MLEETSISVYQLKPSNDQQLAITDKTSSPPPFTEHASSGTLTEPSEKNIDPLVPPSKFHASSIIESRKSSGNRTPKGNLIRTTTTPGGGGGINVVAGRSLSTPVSNLEYKKSSYLIIQNGLTKDQTEEFLRFRQLYCLMWGNIVTVFRMLERLMYDYAIPVAFINPEK